MANKLNVFIIAITLLFNQVTSQYTRDFPRYPQCTAIENGEIETWYDKLEPAKQSDHLKGYAGTVGIIGGSLDGIGLTYFAARAAFNIGADRVIVFCYNTVTDVMKSYDPNIMVYPILNTAIDRAITLLSTVDVVVLSSGLEKDAHSLNTIIPKVINQCKIDKKPLIVNLDTYFLTPNVINAFVNYPYPGVIFSTNLNEFDKLYEVLKTEDGQDMIKINYNKFGPNIYVLRKGCSDIGIGVNITNSFSVNKPDEMKLTHGQGSMVAGFLATYYFRALKMLPKKTDGNGPMMRAAVASYATSKLIRRINSNVYTEKTYSLTTFDMIKYEEEE